jgi:hypothetical protein
MTLTGTISGNMIRLDRPSSLPDGSRVQVEVSQLEAKHLSQEERVALVWKSAGLIRSTPEQARALCEEDYYGVE